MVRKRKGKKLFRVSKPYGYYMEDVEQAVAKYNEVIDKLLTSLNKRDKNIQELKNENARVKDEVQRMQLEMSMLELPDMSHVQEQIILNQFKDQNTGFPGIDPDPPEDQFSKEDLDLPIVGSDDDYGNGKIVDVSGRGSSEFDIVE